MAGEELDPATRTVIEGLADALDADDFEGVRQRLSPECVYTIGDERHVGPDEVVASYRAGSELARRLFDEVVFGHDIVSVPHADEVVMDYRDDLRAGEEWFKHHSRQRITLDAGGLVTRIEDIPIPGEREALAAFMARHGIER